MGSEVQNGGSLMLAGVTVGIADVAIVDSKWWIGEGST